MQTSNPGLLFRSEADMRREEDRREKLARMKGVGDPIHLGRSKPIHIYVEDNFVWSAESNGTVVKRDLKTSTVVRIFRGHRGPVSALCVCQGAESGNPNSGRLVISGSWDKHLRVFDDQTGRLLSDTPAHADFIKTVTYVPQRNIIISGGSDRDIRIWNIPSFGPTPVALECIGVVRGHTRPVSCLQTTADASTGGATLYSADSMGVLLVWRLEVDSVDGQPRHASAIKIGQRAGHSTGINASHLGSAELWTGSSDHTVILHQEAQTMVESRVPIQHPSPVKALLALSATRLQLPYLITGCSDEKIRVFEISAVQTGNGPAELVRTIDAHSHEVSDLALWIRETDTNLNEPWILSASLDGTLRKWKLSDLLSPGRVAAF